MTYNFILPIGSNFPIVSTLLWEIKILFWETKIIFPNVYLLCLHLKPVSQCYFTLFLHPMQNKALQPSFHCALVFLQWHFVLAVKYQVKFFKTETSHLKSIPSNHTAKLCFICSMMCFAKIQLCSQGCFLIDFVDTTTQLRHVIFYRQQKWFLRFLRKYKKETVLFLFE